MPKYFSKGSRKHLATRKQYSEFKKKNPSVKINYRQFRDIIAESNEEICKVILTDKTGFQMPYKLGYLVVNKYKQYKPIVDRSQSKNIGKQVVYTNFHTMGYMYKFEWYSTLSQRGSNKFLNKFRFDASRELKRSLAKILKDGGYNNYLELQKSNFYSASYNKIKL